MNEKIRPIIQMLIVKERDALVEGKSKTERKAMLQQLVEKILKDGLKDKRKS